MPKINFWPTDHDAIGWTFDRIPYSGEDVLLGERVYRVTGEREDWHDSTVAASLRCEYVRPSTHEEQMAQIKRGHGVLPARA